MSRERKIHELIEKGNREEKDRVWAKIQERAREEAPLAVELPKLKARPWRKWAAIAASSCAALLIGVFALVKFFPFGEKKNDGRYFDNQSYERIDVDYTLQEYAQSIEKDLLYFDWYAETDYVKNMAWKLNDTQEIICFQEELVDINSGCVVYLFVTDADDKIDGFSTDENTQSVSMLGQVEVNWDFLGDKAIANFEYEGYRYYLRVEEPTDEEYILALVEELLP